MVVVNFLVTEFQAFPVKFPFLIKCKLSVFLLGSFSKNKRFCQICNLLDVLLFLTVEFRKKKKNLKEVQVCDFDTGYKTY